MYYSSIFSGQEGAMLAIVVMGILVVILIPFIFYLLTLQNALKQVAPQNRQMAPGQVWLVLIPLFNIVWQFIMVTRLANSLETELRSRGLPVDTRPGYLIGIAYCICFCCGSIPFIGSAISLGGFVCWIIHWVQINEYKNKLINTPRFAPNKEPSVFDI